MLNAAPMLILLLRLTFVALFCVGTFAHAAPVIGATVNAATFKTGPIAPGTLVTIFGTGLSTATATASSVPLPTTLGGTVVLLNGLSIPLAFVSPGQINAQLPFRIPTGSATLTVRDANETTANSILSIAASSPGIFTTTANGKGDAIATHANSALVKRATGEYALVGETVILYCTGLGDVNGSPVAGSAAPSSPLPGALQKVEVLMNGLAANVVYAGLTPGSVGLYQINFIVPGGVGGDVPTTIRIGTATSNETIINVAGTFAVAANYSGTLQPRNSSEIWQLDFNSLTSSGTTGHYAGTYTLTRAGAVVDRGSFDFQATQTIFIVQGKSVAGDPFYAAMDTLDAGQSFYGILLEDFQKQDSWYAQFTVVAKAPTPAPPPPPPGGTLPGGALSCSAVEGALIFAQDGKYIGKITSNRFDQDSIGNTFGVYGSQFSTTSIFNPFGQYGSEFSSLSAFNTLAPTPPVIYLKGVAQWFLTTNSTKTPRLAPAQLYPCIGR